jgi:toxin secretion/phage lysis holin
MEKLFLNLLANPYLRLLIIVIVLDTIAGTARAIIQKRLNSSIGTTGLLKNTLILISIAILILFAPLFKLETEANIFTGFYLFQYGLSVIENWEAIGLPVPKWVKDRMENKKREYDENDFNKYQRKDENK